LGKSWALNIFKLNGGGGSKKPAGPGQDRTRPDRAGQTVRHARPVRQEATPARPAPTDQPHSHDVLLCLYGILHVLSKNGLTSARGIQQTPAFVGRLKKSFLGGAPGGATLRGHLVQRPILPALCAYVRGVCFSL